MRQLLHKQNIKKVQQNYHFVNNKTPKFAASSLTKVALFFSNSLEFGDSLKLGQRNFWTWSF